MRLALVCPANTHLPTDKSGTVENGRFTVSAAFFNEGNEKAVTKAQKMVFPRCRYSPISLGE